MVQVVLRTVIIYMCSERTSFVVGRAWLGHRIIEQAVSSRVNSTLKLFISGLVHDFWHHLGFFFQFYLMLAVTVNAIKIKGSNRKAI